jgi:hypothetical protein
MFCLSNDHLRSVETAPIDELNASLETFEDFFAALPLITDHGEISFYLLGVIAYLPVSSLVGWAT